MELLISNTIYGPVCRPGGLEITKTALNAANITADSVIYDIGCGSGVTVRYLNDNGFSCTGIDRSADNENKYIIKANAEKMPYENSTADAVLFECSFSKVDDPKAALSEVVRILKPKGKLIITDFFAYGIEAKMTGALGRLENKETIISRIISKKMTVNCFEVCDYWLKQMWGELIFKYGTQALYDMLEVTEASLKNTHVGYFLLVATKN